MAISIMFVDKMSVDKMPTEDIYVDKMSVNQMSVDQLYVDKML